MEVRISLFVAVMLIFVLHTIITHLQNWIFRATKYEDYITGVLILLSIIYYSLISLLLYDIL